MNNWKYKGKEVKSLEDCPKDVLGFIYKIKNLSNGKYYLGRKTMASMRKKRLTKKEKLLSENKRKTFKQVIVESDWKKYCGSSKPLLEDIKNGDKYSREILRYCFTKAELTYYEAKEILCSDCLLDAGGNYNLWVSAKIYSAHLLKSEKN